MKKPKLHVFEVRWNEEIGHWVLMHGDAIICFYFPGETKAGAVADAAHLMLWLHENCGQCAELRIRNKNGLCSPARTYPKSRDPKRSNG